MPFHRSISPLRPAPPRGRSTRTSRSTRRRGALGRLLERRATDLRSGGAALAVFLVAVGTTQVLPNTRGGVAAEVDPTGRRVLRGIGAGEFLPDAPAPPPFGPDGARQVAGPDPLPPPPPPPAEPTA
ncbi:MAG: hypothetical protein ACT4QF_25110 [Sporichthyaceae bacterium]